MSTAPILVAVDFSELSGRAVEYAVGLAIARKANVDLLHIATHSLPAHAQAHAPPEVLAKIKSTEEVIALRELTAFQQKHIPEEHRGRILLLRGPPATTICEQASKGYDLVVVGTRGRTGLSHILIGSVAERVVRHAPIPVLVVR